MMASAPFIESRSSRHVSKHLLHAPKQTGNHTPYRHFSRSQAHTIELENKQCNNL